MDTIENILVDIPMMLTLRRSSLEAFSEYMSRFGNLSIIRSTLTVGFFSFMVPVRALKRFIQTLGWFTNFRALELHFSPFFTGDRIFEVVDYAYHAWEPVLVYAEIVAGVGGKRFAIPSDRSWDSLERSGWWWWGEFSRQDPSVVK